MTPVVVTLATHSRAAHLDRQRAAVHRHLPGAGHLVVLLDDPAWEPWPGAWVADGTGPMSGAVPMDGAEPMDGAAGDAPALARARNLGGDAAVAAGADTVLFLDVDCLPGPDLGTYYAAALRAHPDAVACGPVTYLEPAPPTGYDLTALPGLTRPHPARPAPPPGRFRTATADEYALFWSLSFAVTADTWHEIRTRTGGFHEGYVGYGGEDTDLGMALRAAGIPMVWVGGAHAYHQHHPVSDPPVEHLDAILTNGALFRDRWGFWPMTGWLEGFARLGLVDRTPDGGWRRAGTNSGKASPDSRPVG